MSDKVQVYQQGFSDVVLVRKGTRDMVVIPYDEVKDVIKELTAIVDSKPWMQAGYE